MLRAQIIGNIGNDPDLRYSANGTLTLSFNVASNGRVRAPSGEWQDRAEWVRVTVLGHRAEALAEHLRRGQRIFADGRLQARPWTDRDNNVRAGLSLLANIVEFLSPQQDMTRATDRTANKPAARIAGPVPSSVTQLPETSVPRATSHDDFDDLPF